MDYIEVSCRLNPPEPWADILIAELSDIGFDSFSEETDGFRAYIPACKYRSKPVKALFEKYRSAGPEKMSFEVNRLGGRNWNAVWESNFEPVLVAGKCLIRAPFHAAAEGLRHEIIIEPKMSFGTGHHETTSLVVEWLLEMDLKGKAVLDMGCGTGVLAILAAQKGAGPVTAIDNYIYAWENTMENAKRNGIQDMRVLHGDASLLGDERYDVIAANITRNVLLEDMMVYERVLNNGGFLLLSGFLAFDKDVIFAEADRLGLQLSGEKQQNDWVSFKLKKR